MILKNNIYFNLICDYLDIVQSQTRKTVSTTVHTIFGDFTLPYNFPKDNIGLIFKTALLFADDDFVYDFNSAEFKVFKDFLMLHNVYTSFDSFYSTELQSFNMNTECKYITFDYDSSQQTEQEILKDINQKVISQLAYAPYTNYLIIYDQGSFLPTQQSLCKSFRKFKEYCITNNIICYILGLDLSTDLTDYVYENYLAYTSKNTSLLSADVARKLPNVLISGNEDYMRNLSKLQLGISSDVWSNVLIKQGSIPNHYNLLVSDVLAYMCLKYNLRIVFEDFQHEMNFLATCSELFSMSWAPTRTRLRFFEHLNNKTLALMSDSKVPTYIGSLTSSFESYEVTGIRLADVLSCETTQNLPSRMLTLHTVKANITVDDILDFEEIYPDKVIDLMLREFNLDAIPKSSPNFPNYLNQPTNVLFCLQQVVMNLITHEPITYRGINFFVKDNEVYVTHLPNTSRVLKFKSRPTSIADDKETFDLLVNIYNVLPLTIFDTPFKPSSSWYIDFPTMTIDDLEAFSVMRLPQSEVHLRFMEYAGKGEINKALRCLSVSADQSSKDLYTAIQEVEAVLLPRLSINESGKIEDINFNKYVRGDLM